jgi:hypothetical protein
MAKRARTHGPEEPILRISAFGFDDEQRAALGALAAAAGRPWRWCDRSQADAWLINGARSRLLEGGDLGVDPGSPGEHGVRLRMDDVLTPLAFAGAAPQAFANRFQFDVASPASFGGLLRHLDGELGPMRTRFVLGQQILHRGAALRHGVFYLIDHLERLLAVLDFRSGEAALAPGLDAARAKAAIWIQVSMGERSVPPGFVPCLITQLSWTYACHTDIDVLPAPYRSRPIHYRGTPKVPLGWLSDEQLVLLRDLSVRPLRFDALVGDGADPGTIAKALEGLYLAAAITTTPSKAARIDARSARESMLEASTGGELVDIAGGANSVLDPTVPADLHPAPRAR